MIRWFRNFAALFKKPREGKIVNTEPTINHSSELETRFAESPGDRRGGYRDHSIEKESEERTGRSESTDSSKSISTCGESRIIRSITSTTCSSKQYSPSVSRYTRSTKSTAPTISSRASSNASRTSTGSDSKMTSAEGTTGLQSQTNTSSTERTRGRSPTKRDNVNAAKGSRMSRTDVLSPTNRTDQLNRSLSSQHENNYHQRKATPNGVWNEEFPPETLIIYTDGSYLRYEQCSGIGIFVAPGHELNRSQRIRGTIQNSDFAEFIAMKTALQNALEIETYRNQKIIIRTDCLNVIDAVAGKRYTPYQDVKSEVIELSMQFKKGVDFQHVYGHDGDPGNELADMFAGIATGRSQGSRGGFRRHSATRERNRQRSKSNDPMIIRQRSHSIPGRL